MLMKNKLKHSLLEILGSPEFDLRIRNAGKFRFPTNYLFHLHSHREFEMNFVKSGSCVMEIGGILTSLREGDCVLVSPGVPHYFMVGIHRTAGIPAVSAGEDFGFVSVSAGAEGESADFPMRFRGRDHGRDLPVLPGRKTRDVHAAAAGIWICTIIHGNGIHPGKRQKKQHRQKF